MSSDLASKFSLHGVSIEKYFEEEKEVFVEHMAEDTSYKPKQIFFIAGKKAITLTYPKFNDESEMSHSFMQTSWMNRVIRAEESILFLDIFAPVKSKTSGEEFESDVFILLQASSSQLNYKVSAYSRNEDVKYPNWNDDYTMDDSHISQLKSIIGSLFFGVTNHNNVLKIEPYFEYLKANNFEIDFHYPVTQDALRVMERELYV